MNGDRRFENAWPAVVPLGALKDVARSSKGLAKPMTQPIRIGAVQYLNTKPLIHELEELAGEAELLLDLPSRLAEQLADGFLDVALIPVIEYFRGTGYRIVPNIAIGSCGPVLSVTLFSRKPWAQIQRVALDVGSRTSAALTQVLLRKQHGIRPELLELPMDMEPDKVDADAVLLIGDRAMGACLPGFAHAYDLGQEWSAWTGLPFVYAVWAVRAGAELGPVEAALHEAKQRGCRDVGQIAHREAPLLGLDAGFCRRYLSNIIRFDLGPREQAGLHHFYMLACELGLARRGVNLEFYARSGLVECG
jgi:chorismate dehydratase